MSRFFVLYYELRNYMVTEPVHPVSDIGNKQNDLK